MITKFDTLENNPREFLKYKNYLFHGSNLGKVGDGAKIISDLKISIQKFTIIKMHTDELKKGDFIEIATRYNEADIFGNKTLIIVNLNSEKLNTEIINFLTQSKTREFTIIFKSDQLSPKSSIRTFFEKNEQSILVPCYEENDSEKLKLVVAYLKKENVSYSSSEIKLLSDSLSNKRLEIKNEIEKIIILTKTAKEKIPIDNILNYISESTDSNPSDFVFSIISKKKGFFVRDLNRFTDYGKDNLKLLSYLIDYLFRILMVKQEITEGRNLDSAIRNLRPPIFFKYRKLFEFHVQSFKENEIHKVLKNLYTCKKKFLSNSWSSDPCFLLELVKFLNSSYLPKNS